MAEIDLSAPQIEALSRMLKIGNNPYGWSASDVGAAGRTMSSLEQRGYVIGGHIYGARGRTYRYTDKAIRIRARLMEGEGEK